MRFLSFMIVFLLLFTSLGCAPQSEEVKAFRATTEAEVTLNIPRKNEVRGLIENYLLQSISLEMQRNPENLSQIATGPYLETRLQVSPPELGKSFIVIRSIEINNLYILEYTPLKIKAIACGKSLLDEVTFEGEFIKSSPSLTWVRVYVFVREDETWKVFTAYDFTDTKGAVRDFAYLSETEKEAIGDLGNYIDMYWAKCLT